MNKVILVGNLVRDPELTTTPNGISVCRFSVAVQRRFANSDGEREADFINCVAWRGLADNIAKYVKKGKKVCVAGSIQTRNYEAQDGTKRYITEVVADDCEFISPRGDGDDGEPATRSKFDDDSASEKSKEPKIAKFEPIDDDDLPF